MLYRDNIHLGREGYQAPGSKCTQMFTFVIGYPRNYQIRVINLIRGSKVLNYTLSTSCGGYNFLDPSVRLSVCESVLQSCFSCQRNSSETAQQNFLKLCSYEGHNAQICISTGNADWILLRSNLCPFWTLAKIFLSNSDETAFCPIARHLFLDLPLIVYSLLKQCWIVGYVSLLTFSFIN